MSGLDGVSGKEERRAVGVVEAWWQRGVWGGPWLSRALQELGTHSKPGQEVPTPRELSGWDPEKPEG